MTGAPIGWLITVAVVAAVLAAALAAGEAGVRQMGREATRPVRSRQPGPDAAAAAAVRGVCEAVVAVAATVALAAAGLVWWQVVLAALAVVIVLAVLVRYAAVSLGQAHAVGAVTLTAPLLAVARAVVAPVRALAPGGGPDAVADAERQDVVDQVGSTEPIEDDEREMVRSVLELGDTITRAVMVPRTEMITLTTGTRLRSALSLFLRSGYSRVPVVGQSVDDLVGVLYLKDVVRRLHTVDGSDDDPIDDLVREPVFVPESKPVDDLLRELQRGSSHLAVVVDEFGGIAGLVTVEDAVEEIVGEVVDEHDRSGPEVEPLTDGAYRIPSRLSLDELGELFGIEIDDDDVDTAGGLLAKALGKVPLAGSSAEVAGLVLVADRVEGRRKQVSTLVASRAAHLEEER